VPLPARLSLERLSIRREQAAADCVHAAIDEGDPDEAPSERLSSSAVKAAERRSVGVRLAPSNSFVA
jgi:hypothetical protein